MKNSDIFRRHLQVKGLKGSVWAYGLSSPRYVEYTAALRWMESNRVDMIVDIGCGHSIAPSLWTILAPTLLVELNVSALKYQIKNNKSTGDRLTACMADASNLPVRHNSMKLVIAISSIEHIPQQGDIRAIQEISRVLEVGGLLILSVPFSTNGREIHDYYHLIPPMLRRIMGARTTKSLMSRFEVDRSTSFFERKYDRTQIKERILQSSGLVVEDYVFFSGDSLRNIVHRSLLPVGLLALVEFYLAKHMTMNKYEADGGVILRLSKTD